MGAAFRFNRHIRHSSEEQTALHLQILLSPVPESPLNVLRAKGWRGLGLQTNSGRNYSAVAAVAAAKEAADRVPLTVELLDKPVAVVLLAPEGDKPVGEVQSKPHSLLVEKLGQEGQEHKLQYCLEKLLAVLQSDQKAQEPISFA
eukprot:GCRY01001171.1.p2 GENE.GCRY01001171.1~~GCRY01001171.1.p2  ORF type:complete len:145 (-),score=25.29 GCRY01001171.1:517-951(-)